MNPGETPAPLMRLRRSITASATIDVGCVFVLFTIGLFGFVPVFDSWLFLVAGLGGFILVAGAIGASYRYDLGLVLTLLLTIVAWFLAGPALAVHADAALGFLPTIQSLAELCVGSINGWADLVTLSAPAGLPTYITVVPYLAGGLVALATSILVLWWIPRRTRTVLRSAVLLLGPLALYAASVVLGTELPYLPGIRGIGFALIALGWLGWRRSDATDVAVTSRADVRRRRARGTAVIAAIVIVVGTCVGVAAAPPQASRFVLRNVVVPPVQNLVDPSPLSAFRHFTKTLARKTLFTVAGLKPGEYVRIATLDTYNGQIWGVAGAQSAAGTAGDFRLVGQSFPQSPDATQSRKPSSISVTIDDYSNVWMPDAGYATTVDFERGLPSGGREDLRYNSATGTMVLTSGVARGLHYRLVSTPSSAPEDADAQELIHASVAPKTGDVADPDLVSTVASKITASASTPSAKLNAIVTYLHTGYFSHGDETGGNAPSPAGHGADRMVAMIEPKSHGGFMVGDQEQYSSLFALMADSLGYRVRVVMGFNPKVTSSSPARVAVTGADVTAWDEVYFTGVGWIRYLPTPTHKDVPQNRVAQPASEPAPQIRQPPRTNDNSNDLVSPVQTRTKKTPKKHGFVLAAWVVPTSLGILIPAILILAPLLIVGAWKSRRALRRRRAPRGDLSVAGAWDELLDQLRESGFSPAGGTTRIRIADSLAPQLANSQSDLRAIALLTDEAVFSGRDISGSTSDDVWDRVASVMNAARLHLGAVRRFVSRYRVSTLQQWAGRTTRSVVAAARRPIRPNE